MANHGGSSMSEGRSSSRPPLFNGTNYGTWRLKMKIFIQSQNRRLWKSIVNGYTPPTTKVNGEDVVKTEDDFNDIEAQEFESNLQAMNLLYCALSENEFNRISICECAKDIWDRLEITYEGTPELKDSRVSVLMDKLEKFKMIKGETVSEMEKRFTEIIHPLKSLGKTFTNEEIVKRFMKATIPPYTSKIDAIEEGRDFHNLTLDILVSKLMKKEMELKKDEVDVPKGKTIALKANPISNDSSEEELDSDEDIGMLSRKFKMFLKKKRQEGKFMKKKPLSKGEASKNDEIICYRCKKPGHVKWDCPLRRSTKEKRPSKRAYGAWTDEDESENEASNVEEVANLCFMAIDDETQDEVISSPSSTYTFEELQEAFDELLDNFKRISAKNISLKKSMSKLSSENDQMKLDLNALHDELDLYKNENNSVTNENITLNIELRDLNQSMLSKLDDVSKENESLKNENVSLKKKCHDLNASLAKFVNGRDRLDAILGSQRASYRKEGLGYVPLKKQSTPKISFIKASTSSTPFVTCYYCGRKCHISQSCWYKRNEHKIKTMWVPKNYSRMSL